MPWKIGAPSHWFAGTISQQPRREFQFEGNHCGAVCSNHMHSETYWFNFSSELKIAATQQHTHTQCTKTEAKNLDHHHNKTTLFRILWRFFLQSVCFKFQYAIFSVSVICYFCICSGTVMNEWMVSVKRRHGDQSTIFRIKISVGTVSTVKLSDVRHIQRPTTFMTFSHTQLTRKFALHFQTLSNWMATHHIPCVSVP